MHARPDETLMQAAFAGLRNLEPTDADVARAIARARDTNQSRAGRVLGSGRGWRRLAAPGLAALLLLGAGAYAVPPTRAAIDDLADSFSAWVAGDSSEAPGRALGTNEEAPAYFHSPRYADNPRVIAAAGGYKLYAALMPDGMVEFDLGNTGVGLGFAASDFDERSLYVLGPGSMETADENGHVPLFGVTARSVSHVELTYEAGPSLRANAADGGFVLLVEPGRAPREVIAYDAGGKEVARELVDDSDHFGPRIDWTQFGSPTPVPSQP